MPTTTIGYATKRNGVLIVHVAKTRAEMVRTFRNAMIYKVSYTYEGMGNVSNVKVLETL